MNLTRSGRGLLATLGSMATVAAFACTSNTTAVPADHLVPLGTWGGDSGGLIVGDTSAHLHIGCTFGDISGRVPVSDDGRFDVAVTVIVAPEMRPTKRAGTDGPTVMGYARSM
jgi:hypothetical protein